MPDVFLPYQTNLNRQRNDFKSLTNGVPALHKYDINRDLVAKQNNKYTDRVTHSKYTVDLQLNKDFNNSMLKKSMNLFVLDELLEHRNPISLPYWKGGFFTQP